MEYEYESSFSLKEFFEANSEGFESALLEEAVNVKGKINEILTIGNIDLINNAHKLVVYIIEDEEQKLFDFAEYEGIAWAKHSLTLSFKLEWVQAIRRTLWTFIKKYYELTRDFNSEDFFQLEQQKNNMVDTFLNNFFISYSTYKDSLIQEQSKLVENLSVPIIPINSSICILPLIGSINSGRAEVIEEKVLVEIGKSRMEILIMDLSGVASIESNVIPEFIKVTDSVALMGCSVVITGFRKEIVKEISRTGIVLNEKTETLGTLQQALSKYLK